MTVISGVYWDKGDREINQDSLILEQVLTKRGRVVLAAVCDGIGGLSEGEIAGGFVCEKLRACFYGELLPFVQRHRGRKSMIRCLHRCIYEAGVGLRSYAEGTGTGMGTTLSVLLIWNRHYVGLHLGDSRIYRLEKKRIQQLTTDHRREPNILTRCLGSFGYQKPEEFFGSVGRNTGFLLCSDGFYNCQEKELLREICSPLQISSEGAIGKRLRELAGYGIKRGETDNMSAIYLLCRR